MSGGDDFEEALARFQQLALEYGGGLAHHGPMAADALARLGHPAKIPAFVDVYAPRLPPIERGEPLDEAGAAIALGNPARAPEWIATFEARVAADDWRAVLRAALPGLLPGLFAGAGHGLLRVAHGVRALGDEDTPLRRREIAHGLAYWGARFQPLPGAPAAWTAQGRDVASALVDWPRLDDPAARAGLFFEAVRRLEGRSDLAEALAGVAMPVVEGVDDFLDALCRAAASLYVRHPASRIAYVHALTLPSALRTLLPFLEPGDRVAACGFVLQAVGALHALFGEEDGAREPSEEVARIAAGDWAEIRYHAACSIEEHAIKMTEACWREDRRRPDPIFRRAAADAALEIGGRGQASVC